MYDNILPLGSVIRMRDSQSEVAIIGYYPIVDNKRFKYLCVNYPFGLSDGLDIAVLDEEGIEMIEHLGYQDEYAKRFCDALQTLAAALTE